MAKREMKTKTTEEQIVEETTVETPVVEEKCEDVLKTETEEIKPLIGIVNWCSRLNIRKKPNIKAEVIKVINANDKVTIFADKSNKDWYCVRVTDTIEGFCMKKFITIK